MLPRPPNINYIIYISTYFFFFYLVCNLLSVKQKEVVAVIYAMYEWNERARLPERVWVAEF